MRGRSKILVPAAAACVAGICSPQVYAQKVSNQTGLRADYFSNAKLSGNPQLSRVDKTVNFWWMDQAVHPKVGRDNFSVRWSGMIQAPVSGAFTFGAFSDEGIRVTVDGRRVLDHWDGHAVKHDIGTPVTLDQGKWYPITVEYYEVQGDAIVHLLWSYPGRSSQTVPTQYLRPDAPAQPPAPVVLTAPANVHATGIWDGSAPAVDVTGDPVQGALNYRVYRGGTIIASGLSTPRFRDTAVRSGEVYAYRMTAIGTDGSESPQSDPLATATAPFPLTQAVSKFGTPPNLRLKGVWNNGSSDVLTWQPVADAVGYNVYQYDTLIARGVTSPTFTVPPSLWHNGLTYNVTAVNSEGVESLPSNLVTAAGAYDPQVAPQWWQQPATPAALQNLRVTPEWNNEKPRVLLEWEASLTRAANFNVYRDGVLIAEGVWGLTYVDDAVKPGARHAYSVSGTNVNWTRTQEGPRTPEATVTTLTQAPAPAGVPVVVTRVESNDDSVIVYFNAVPGAVDYACYKASSPNVRKYSAGGLSIEMNGIDPVNGADLIVEAVDKFGPYQKIDGDPGPGGMQHDGSVRMEVNGIGDPSNAPNVLARSSVFHVNCQPVQLTGEQVFFDTFRNSSAFRQVFPIDQRILNGSGGGANDASNPFVREYQNDKWIVRNYLGDMDSSRIFVMSNHFMDTLYDGGTPRSSVPMHNNNASLVMQPKATADISGGRVLHVTMEVDPHFNGRRWCDVFVAAADDPLIVPGKFFENNNLPTASGNMFRWEILAGFHNASIFRGINGQLDALHLTDTGYGPNNERYTNLNRQESIGGRPPLNGSMADLDRRHKYDLYLSQNRFRIVENGLVLKDAIFPEGRTLPFSRVAVYFVHQLYHTGNDQAELRDYNQKETYWINRRPWADERHWDNMGFEVLPAFPADAGSGGGGSALITTSRK